MLPVNLPRHGVVVEGVVSETRAHCIPIPLVLLLQAVLFHIMPPLHLPPVCLLLGTEGLGFPLLCLQQLLMLMSGETLLTAQPVKARIQCCLCAALHIAHSLLSGNEPLTEGCPLCILLSVE